MATELAGGPVRTERRLRVCAGHELGDGDYRAVAVRYAGEEASVLVFRFDGRCMAYRNQCVHMPRPLTCERDVIFDRSGRLLRCSMHGIVYDPLTGESLSTMCNGERLTPVRVYEDDDGVWIDDKRVRPAADSPD